MAGLLLPTGGLSGRSAAVLWGCHWLTRTTPDEVVRRGGVCVTTPTRTALDLARRSPEEDAVVCLHRFLRAGLVRPAVLEKAADSLTCAGCRQVRRAVSLSDGLAESPQETRVRLLMRSSRLPRPIAQHIVRRADGTFVARVDFAWPDRRVALEYEGAWHGAVQQVARDRRRLNALTAERWTVVFVTAADLHDPVALIARIAAALDVPGYASGRSHRGE